MSRVPNFADLPLSDVSSRSDASLDRNAWRQRAAAADDLAGLEHLETMPGLPPFMRGPYPRCM
jgi:methylmalonyl-CoA mutase